MSTIKMEATMDKMKSDVTYTKEIWYIVSFNFVSSKYIWFCYMKIEQKLFIAEYKTLWLENNVVVSRVEEKLFLLCYL